MATDYVDPNFTNTAQWAGSTGTPHHLQVDDAVRQPGNPGTATYVRYQDGDENDDEDYSFSTLTVASVSSVRVWFYIATRTITEDCWIRIYMGGWTGQLRLDFTQTGVKWYSLLFSGTWTQADLNGLRVEYAAPPSIGKTNNGTLYCTYCEITYVAVVLGYGHDYMGVPAANIGSVMGVPTANIASINGV